VVSTEAAISTVTILKDNVIIDTSDFSLKSHTVKLTIKIHTTVIATVSVTVYVEFTVPPPQFDYTGFTVDPITCSEKD